MAALHAPAGGELMRRPTARREQAPSPQLTRVAWLLTSVGLLTTGVLVGAASIVRWWGSCLPSAVYTAVCTTRQSGQFSGHHFGVVSDDLRASAVLHALAGIVAAITWLGFLVIGPPYRWARIGTSIGAGGLTVIGLADLLWRTFGWRPLGSNLTWLYVVCWLILVVINFSPSMQFIAAEALASRRRGSSRLPLLIITVIVAGPPGTFADMLFWRAAYNATSDAGPGEGMLLSPLVVILSVVIMVVGRIASRPRPAKPDQPDYPDHPDRPDLTLAA
jgi:hypothetical protein